MTTSTAMRAARPSFARRLWRSPLWLHALALAGVLLVGLAVIGPRVAFSSDEGVAVLQARMLREGDGWIYHYPLARIDREGRARPFVHGDVGSNGVAPYAKHPLYPLLLAGLDAVGGVTAMLVAGILGTVLAALLAALLARRLDPGLDRLTLWIVGAGSPLFFDAYVVLAHTLAAAAAAAAARALAVLLTAGTRRATRAWCLAGAMGGLAIATWLRTEVVFLGPALAVGVGVGALVGKVPWRRALLVGGGAVVACAGAYAIDHVAAGHILGSALPAAPDASRVGGLTGRWDALHTTLLLPSYLGPARADLALALGAITIFAGAVALHWRGERRQFVVGALAVAAVAYVAHLFLGPGGPVPGLILAFPAGWFLVWVAGKRTVEGAVAPVLVVASAVVFLAVLATEYSIGGGVEWGGRYFSVLIAIIVPVLVVAAAPVVRRHGRDLARVVVALVAVATIASSVIALQGLRHWHEDTAQVLDQIARQAQVAGRSGGLDRPVVLTSNRLLPQIDYRDFDDVDWVAVDPDDLSTYANRLAGIGVTRLVLASTDQAADLRRLPGWRVVQPAAGGSSVDVSVLERSGSG